MLNSDLHDFKCITYLRVKRMVLVLRAGLTRPAPTQPLPAPHPLRQQPHSQTVPGAPGRLLSPGEPWPGRALPLLGCPPGRQLGLCAAGVVLVRRGGGEDVKSSFRLADPLPVRSP